MYEFNLDEKIKEAKPTLRFSRFSSGLAGLLKVATTDEFDFWCGIDDAALLVKLGAQFPTLFVKTIQDGYRYLNELYGAAKLRTAVIHFGSVRINNCGYEEGFVVSKTNRYADPAASMVEIAAHLKKTHEKLLCPMMSGYNGFDYSDDSLRAAIRNSVDQYGRVKKAAIQHGIILREITSEEGKTRYELYYDEKDFQRAVKVKERREKKSVEKKRQRRPWNKTTAPHHFVSVVNDDLWYALRQTECLAYFGYFRINGGAHTITMLHTFFHTLVLARKLTGKKFLTMRDRYTCYNKEWRANEYRKLMETKRKMITSPESFKDVLSVLSYMFATVMFKYLRQDAPAEFRKCIKDVMKFLKEEEKTLDRKFNAMVKPHKKELKIPAKFWAILR